MRYCANCGRLVSEFDMHHLKYRSQGGSDDPKNLQVLCKPCHVKLHSERGDFSIWGKRGGEIQGASLMWLFSLRQFRDCPKKRAEWVSANAPQRLKELKKLERKQKGSRT